VGSRRLNPIQIVNSPLHGISCAATLAFIKTTSVTELFICARSRIHAIAFLRTIKTDCLKPISLSFKHRLQNLLLGQPHHELARLQNLLSQPRQRMTAGLSAGTVITDADRTTRIQAHRAGGLEESGPDDIPKDFTEMATPRSTVWNRRLCFAL
jgi:hypothetical protein